MKSSRRSFARTLALGAVTPLAPIAKAQQKMEASAQAQDLGLKVIDVKTSDLREKQIREALQNTARQVAGIRAYRLKRDTPPALFLGVFDA